MRVLPHQPTPFCTTASPWLRVCEREARFPLRLSLSEHLVPGEEWKNAREGVNSACIITTSSHPVGPRSLPTGTLLAVCGADTRRFSAPVLQSLRVHSFSFLPILILPSLPPPFPSPTFHLSSQIQMSKFSTIASTNPFNVPQFQQGRTFSAASVVERTSASLLPAAQCCVLVRCLSDCPSLRSLPFLCSPSSFSYSAASSLSFSFYLTPPHPFTPSPSLGMARLFSLFCYYYFVTDVVAVLHLSILDQPGVRCCLVVGCRHLLRRVRRCTSLRHHILPQGCPCRWYLLLVHARRALPSRCG